MRHFFPTPRQYNTSMTRALSPTVPSPPGPSGSMGDQSFIDGAGRSQNVPADSPYIVVEVITGETDGNVTDANGNYFCKKRDTWFGPNGIFSEMRLQPVDGVTFSDGDRVLGCWTPNTDGWPLVTPLLWNLVSPSATESPVLLTRKMLIGGVWAYEFRAEIEAINSDGTPLIIPDEYIGLLPVDPVLLDVQDGNGVAPQIWSLSIDAGGNAVVGGDRAPGGAFILDDGGGAVSFPYGSSAGMIQAGLSGVYTVTGVGTVASPYVFTGTDNAMHGLTLISNLTPNLPSFAGFFRNLTTAMDVPVEVFAKLAVSGTEVTSGIHQGYYWLFWSNGTECTGIVGGVDPTKWTGYNPAATEPQPVSVKMDTGMGTVCGILEDTASCDVTGF